MIQGRPRKTLQRTPQVSMPLRGHESMKQHIKDTDDSAHQHKCDKGLIKDMK